MSATKNSDKTATSKTEKTSSKTDKSANGKPEKATPNAQDKKQPEDKEPQNLKTKGSALMIRRRIDELDAEDIVNVESLDLSRIDFGGEISKEAKKEIERCKNLRSLVITESQLKSLENLPVLKHLIELDLSSNQIPDLEVRKLAVYAKSLRFLSLAENSITKLETANDLLFLQKIERLELMDNPIQQLPNYFSFVMNALPTLQELDSKDKQGNELEINEEGEMGYYSDSEDEEDGEEGDEGEQGEEGQEGQEDEEDDEDQEDEEELAKMKKPRTMKGKPMANAKGPKKTKNSEEEDFSDDSN